MNTHARDITVGLRKSIGAGIAIVIAATTLARFQKFGYVASEALASWEVCLAEVLTGAVLGAGCWILVRPRARFTQGMLLAVASNWGAWAAFLAFTPPLEEAEFHAIAEGRATRDAGEGLDLITDQPTVMAARWFGGFRSMPVPERLLFLMAGVPVLMTEPYVVPARYLGSPPTHDESLVIAAIGFVVSTAFWATVSGAMGWLRRRRSAAPPPNPPLQPTNGAGVTS